MSQPDAKRLTFDEFLELERREEFKHEVVDGQMVAMAGNTVELPAVGISLTMGEIYDGLEPDSVQE